MLTSQTLWTEQPTALHFSTPTYFILHKCKHVRIHTCVSSRDCHKEVRQEMQPSQRGSRFPPGWKVKASGVGAPALGCRIASLYLFTKDSRCVCPNHLAKDQNKQNSSFNKKNTRKIRCCFMKFPDRKKWRNSIIRKNNLHLIQSDGLEGKYICQQ